MPGICSSRALRFTVQALLCAGIAYPAALSAQPSADPLSPRAIERAMDVARWPDSVAAGAREPRADAMSSNVGRLFVQGTALLYHSAPDSAIEVFRQLRLEDADTRNRYVRWSLYEESHAQRTIGNPARAESLLTVADRAARSSADTSLRVVISLVRMGWNYVQRSSRRVALLDTLRSLVDTTDREAYVGLLCLEAHLDPNAVVAQQRTTAIAARAGGWGARRQQSLCHYRNAVRAMNDQRLPTAAREYLITDSLAQLTGDRSLRAVTNQRLGHTYNLTGLSALGERYCTIALQEANAAHDILALGYTWLTLGNIANNTDDRFRAARFFHNADALFAQVGTIPPLIDALISRIDLELKLRAYPAAERAIREADSLASTIRDSVYIDRIRVWKVNLAISQADSASANGLIKTREEFWLTRPGNQILSYSNHQRGLLALRMGLFDEAIDRLTPERQSMSADQLSAKYALSINLAAAHACRGDAQTAAAMALRALDSLDDARANVGDIRMRDVVSQLRRDIKTIGYASSASLVKCLVDRGDEANAFLIAERIRDRHLRELSLPRGANAGPNAAQESRTVTLARLKASIPDSTTMVLAFTASDPVTPITLFAVTARDTRTYALPIPDTVRALVTRLQAQMQSGRSTQSLARALGEQLLNPALANASGQVRRIVVVPDEEIFDVPWNALETKAGPAGLRYAISVVPSASEIVARWKSPAATLPLRVVAYGAPTIVVDSLPPLPRAADEARQAALRDPHGIARVGALATESSLKKSLLKDVSVLHLATHAQPAGTDLHGGSGLVFLAPSDDDDGFLEASEISRLSLNGALVILSGCSTAVAENVVGAGMRSLATAFLEAGAGAVLATQRSVGDKEMQLLVKAFYDSYSRGVPADESLRRAQARVQSGRGFWMFASRRPAQQWSPFTLVGDGRIAVLPNVSGLPN